MLSGGVSDLGDCVRGNKGNLRSFNAYEGYAARIPRVSLRFLVGIPVAVGHVVPTESPIKPTYSVVVPVLNEAGNIATLVEEIFTAMEGLPDSPAFELIYVDDGSQDETPQELQIASEQRPLIICAHMRQTGQSQALLTGIDRASGEWVITLDGDGQNDPKDISILIDARDAALAAEPDRADAFLFIGHRRLRHDSLVKRYQSWLANDIRGWLLGDFTPDSGCGLKLFRKDVCARLPRFDAMHRFLPALFIRNGGRAISMEISHRPRTHGVSKYGFWRRLVLGVIDLLGMIWLNARYSAPKLKDEKDAP